METMKYWAMLRMEAWQDHRCHGVLRGEEGKYEIFGTFCEILGAILRIYKRLADIKCAPPQSLPMDLTLFGMNGKKYDFDMESGPARKMGEIIRTFRDGHKKTWETTIRKRWERDEARGYKRRIPLYMMDDAYMLFNEIRDDLRSGKITGKEEIYEELIRAIISAIHQEQGCTGNHEHYLPLITPLGKKSKALAVKLWDFWRAHKQQSREG